MSTDQRRRIPSAFLLAIVGALLLFLGATVNPAQAAQALNVSSASPTDPSAMAYSTYNVTTNFTGDSPRSLQIDLPKGQLGAVQNAATCADATFNAGNTTNNPACPAASRIGAVTAEVTAIGLLSLTATGYIFRLPATGTEAMRIGIIVRDTGGIANNLRMYGTLRIREDGSYGIRAAIPTLPDQANNVSLLFGASVDINIDSMTMNLWGRINNGGVGTPGFMFNPAECIPATTAVTAWNNANYGGSTATATRAYTPTNCTGVNAPPYNPSLAFLPASSPASAPTNFGVGVTQPYSATATKVNAPFKDVTVTLPPGAQLTAASDSDGNLEACAATQFESTPNSLARPTCLPGSEVGTVQMDSPLVGTLTGKVYLAQPRTGSDLVQLFMMAEQGVAADAVRVKLKADVSVNGADRLVATLTSLPAQPVTNFQFNFRSGSAPAMRQPRMCGVYQGDASLLAWTTSATAAARSANLTVDSNCPPPSKFTPTIAMTSTPSKASAPTTGVTTIDMPIADEPVTQTRVSLPAGMIANISGKARCSAADLAIDDCDPGTKIGTVRSLAGQVLTPGTFDGDIFLTDAPDAQSIVGLYIRVPVLVGPINLDTLKITASLRLRTDFGIDVVAAVPEKVRGLQIDMQRLRLTFDALNFLHNPPTCTGNTVGGQFTSSLGTTRTTSSPLTIDQCASLNFNPAIAFSATPASAGSTGAVTTTVTVPQTTTAANAQGVPKRVVATLPAGVSLGAQAGTAAGGALTSCSAAQFAQSTFAAPTCPAGSEVGTTTIQTPSVGQMSGKVYLGAPAAGRTARVYIYADADSFTGKAAVKLEGFLDVNSSNGNVTVDIDGIPPAAFTSFALAMRGGDHGVLSMPRGCVTAAGSAQITPHHTGTATTVNGSLNVTPCPDENAFNPSFALTGSPTTAGAPTALTQTITVPDRHRQLDRIAMSLPAGMLANIQGVPRCSLAQANAGTCAASTKIGDVQSLAGNGAAPKSFNGEMFLTDAPSAGDIVGIAIKIPAVVGPIDLGNVITLASVRLRPSDFGIDVVANVPTRAAGVPLNLQTLRLIINRAGFLTNPATCASQTASADLRGAGGSTVNRTANYQATGCGSIEFNPAISFAASPASAGGTSGLTTTVTVAAPTPGNGAGVPRRVVATLPAGVSLGAQAATAAGATLAGCTPAQFDSATFAAPTCPASSIVGTTTIQTPSIGQLTGTVYLGTAISGHTARVFIYANSDNFPGTAAVKLTGLLDTNPTTGDVTVDIDQIPSAAFTSFELAMRGGDHAVLAMPRTCGIVSGSAQLTPQHTATSSTVTGSVNFNTNCGDATSFNPTFSATTSTTAAGVSTNLTQTVTVPERHRSLDHLELNLPAGMLANVDGIARCTLAQAGAGTCPAATKIGDVETLAGQGASPKTFNGELYLTNAPTAGDIVGIAIKIPAVVGPIDLGNVTTIASVKLRPSDYGIDVIADVPTRASGVPLNLRELRMIINRSGFLTNPVTCGSDPIDASLRGQGGAAVSRNVAYQATGCASLAFNPTVAFSAAPQAAAGASAFTATINAPTPTDATPQAALKTAVVNLPTGVSLSASINSGGSLAGCTAAQFAQGTFADPTCPAASELGTATIVTPSVGTLTGKVYLGQVAPTGAVAGLYLDAKGTAFPEARVKIAGRVDVNETTGQTTATFDNAPAVVFTSFALQLRGGTEPALSVPRTCGTPQGTAVFSPQSGADVNRSGTLTINTNCGDADSFGATGAVSLGNTNAGADTSMTVALGVPAGHRELSKVKITTPDGLLAKLDGRATCSLAAANAGTCPAATQIGTLQALAGQGTAPAPFNGTVYLTDAPTANDIVGIAMRVPVVAGPVDLGTLNVVAGAKLTPGYGLEINADVPTQIEGIPMYLRGLDITINASNFLFNASKCSTEQAEVELTSATYAGDSSTVTRTNDLTTTNCAGAQFHPTVAFSANPKQAGGASAFTTRISLLNGDSALERATVQLPAGVSLSPSASSDGLLTGCTTAQFAISDVQNAPTCPAASDVGNVTIETPAVGDLTGDIYLASTAPGGKIARVMVYARSVDYPSVRVKFEGTISADAGTGLVTADFDAAPQVPFTDLTLAFRGGTNPVISVPRTCGQPSGTVDFKPYASTNVQTGNAQLTIDEECGDTGSFSPTLGVTAAPTTAGAPTTLTTTIGVPERHRPLDRIALDLPAGLLAKIDGHPLCSIAAAGTATCPAATKIGSVRALAGQGTTPGVFNGELFLTQPPTPGDAAGIAVKLPAIVGPVDLGNVVTIGSVKLRPSDYGLSVTADVPTRQQGIDLHLRELRLTIDEPGFMSNAVTCGALNTSASLRPQGGGAVTRTAPYQATNCAALGFNPSVSFDATPPRAAGASAFRTQITAPASTPASPQAALKTAAVELPTGVALSSSINSGSNLTGCSAGQFDVASFADPTCPAGSEIGTVSLTVPQVGALTGKLYLAQTTPSGAIAGLYLDAESTTYGVDAIRVKLTGKIDVEEATGKTTATFDNAPPVAFTSLELTLRGGTSPAVSMPRTCGTPQGSAALSPQSGAAVNRTASLTVNQNCGDADSFGASGSVTLSDYRAARDTNMTINASVPSGHRELAKLSIATPPGLLAKVDGKTTCSVADANAGACAAATEIGTVTATAGQGTAGTFTGKAYLVAPPTPDDIVGIGISIPVQVGPVDLGKVNVVASAELRPDYGLNIEANIPTKVKGIPMYLRTLQVAVNTPNFMFNPSTCSTENATIGLESASYAGNTSTTNDASAMTFTDCASVPFDPQVEFEATPKKAGGAASFTTRITMPNSSAALDDATITLPAGVSLSPSINSGGGLVGCADAQFNLSNPQTAPSCAGPSEIGDVTIQTPAVGELVGKVYLAATAPAGQLARVMVYARSLDYASARTKFEGVVRANAGTGIVTAEFTDAPPVPFTAMDIDFRGGTNPAISVPRTCGTTSGTAVMKPKSSSSTVSRNGDLVIDEECGDANSFSPTLSTSVTPTTAGAPTALTTTVTVPERHRPLDRIALNLPAGLLAKIDGHALCSIASANAGTCAPATKIGDVRALAGQGTNPGTFNGELFLTQPPTAGDAAGIAVKLPAIVGPVDLGNVITVGSVRLRPSDYGLTVTADVPTRQQGIDLHLRELRLAINEANFMTNAASCDALQTTSSLRAVGGATATPSAPYQATNCAGLGFNPSVSFDAAPPRAAGASAFTTRITAPASTSANPQGALKKAVVDLPTGVALSASIDSDNALAGCTAAQFDAASFADPTCPAASEVGNVTLQVPQVGALTGKLYLTQTAPTGAIAGLYLDAESTTYGVNAIRIKLAGKIDVDEATGKTTATFDNAPSVAFTSLELTLRGGASPAVSMPRTCGTPQGSAQLTPQSGAAVDRNGTLTVDQNCGDAAAFGVTGTVALSDTRAGQDTELTTNLAIPSGHRELQELKIALPTGLLAKIDGKVRCSVANANAGTCAANTEIGSITAAAGQGTPDNFTGTAYLVDAPSSNDIVGIGFSIPVQAGPVDLGKVNLVAAVQLRDDYGIDITAQVPTRVKGIPMYLRNLAVEIDRSDFLFNPSTCSTKPISMQLTSATYGGNSSTATVNDTVTVTDCAGVSFNPTVSFDANPRRAGGSGSFTTQITLPATGQSAMEGAAVTLPAGMSLSPSIDSDATLTGCTTAQFAKSTPFTTPTCPAASKIGSVELSTQTIGELTGDVYLASTAPGHLARVMVYAASTEFPGARVKFEGVVDVNESTGVTTADFSQAPEVPFTSLEMTFRGGDKPALSLPRTCGTQQGTALLRSHAGTNATRNANLTINTDCTRSGEFTPTTTITTTPSTAAAATTLMTRVELPAGQQELDRVRLSLPKGLIAKIDGHPRCSVSAAQAGTCSTSAQIGTVTAKAGQGDVPGTFTGRVFLTDAPGTHPNALVGLAVELPIQVGTVGGNPVVDLGKVTSVGAITLRTDYGIDVDVPVPTEVKGVPAYLREFTLLINESGFMVNPPTCSGNAVTGTLNAKQGGSAAVSTTLPVSGCGAANFNPQVSFSATPDTPAAQSQLRTRITLPATGDQSPLKTAVVRLPDGVSLTASANHLGDLVGCTDAQFNKSSWADPTCPAGSKIGSLEIQTPYVGGISGDAYIAATAPNGVITRIFLDGESAQFGDKVRIKLEGSVVVDETTGATTASFDELPPVGFTSFELAMRGAPNPVVSLPRTCGTYGGAGTLTPHAGSVATRSGSLTLNSSCPPANQFGPQVSFDLSPNGAGDHGTLKTTITVPGGDDELKQVRVEMPEGLTAKLQGATRCTIAQAQADNCPALSRIGTVAAKVGVAGAPYTQNGNIYLTEGRNGNIAGMAIILPAVVGPIDLGKVVAIADVQLRSPDLALRIDAAVPTRVKGVRLDVREMELNIGSSSDGQFYLLNPSSCGNLTGTARFTSLGDRTANDDGTITIAAGSCASQTFNPELEFSAGNPKPNQVSTFTTKITHTDGPGAEAPFKSATVRLPDGVSMSASAGHNGDLAGCTDAQFHQDDLSIASTCPAGSEIGTTQLDTTLVGALVGKAYLAPATGGNIARIFLETEATDVDNLTVRLVGEVNVNETTGITEAVFADVPAIPMTGFTVTFRGGTAPVLALPRTCGTTDGSGRFESVNGAVQNRTASFAVTTDCPMPGAFEPTAALTRSNTEAGKSIDFGTSVAVPQGHEELRGLRMSLPAGLLGEIASIPACSITDAQAGNCAAASRVGAVSAKVGLHAAPFTVTGDAYLVRGDNNSIARLALVLPAVVGPVDLGEVITIAELRLRNDYGLDVYADEIPTRVKGVRLDLHEFALNINRPDFMVNPVSCGTVNAVTTLRSAGSPVQSRDRTQGLTTTDCDDLKLDAALDFAAAPASPLKASAVTTKIRATDGGGVLDAMKKVTVTMPEGLSLSPSAGARGDLAECTPAQFNQNDISVDANCPAGSKVGTVALNSPMVGDLSGDVYLGQKSGGHFSGVYFQATGPDYPSLRVKIGGYLDVDETTGRMTATFDGLPQVQVSSIDLTLRGGDAPVLGLPRTCGQFGASASVERHGGGNSGATGSLTLNEDCPDGNAFGPQLDLSASPTQAGSNTALTTTITVPARQQELKSLQITMPKGLLGRLTVAAQCPVDAARAGNCGADSEVGDVTAKVGVASAPFSTQGKAYMTQGYDGAIAGLMFKLPAKVGPIDLGDVITLAKLELLGNDVQLRITATEIPTRVKGIPLNISELRIGMSRPGVVVNASSCEAKSASASFGSEQGGSAQGSAGYQATGCEGLNWQPTMSTKFTGPQSDIDVKGHPTLTTVINQTEGQGTLKSAAVTLPEGIGADLTNISSRWCMEMSDAIAGNCAEKSKLGTAEIVTSALPTPVKGDVIMVRVQGQVLPGLLIRIRDRMSVDVVGQSRLDTKTGQVIASFDGLPDTQISKMTLVFNGGSNGVLVLTKPLCGVSGLSTTALLGAHHGATKNLASPVDCDGRKSAGGSTTTPGTNPPANSVVTFVPSPNGASTMTFALSNPNGISKVVLKMPKGAIFTKGAYKLVKPTLTGAKAKFKAVNGERRMAIGIYPLVKGEKVTKIKFKLPKKAIKINVKVRKVLNNKKTSKKKKQQLLAKLLKPSVSVVDSDGKTNTVKITTKVSAK